MQYRERTAADKGRVVTPATTGRAWIIIAQEDAEKPRSKNPGLRMNYPTQGMGMLAYS